MRSKVRKLSKSLCAKSLCAGLFLAYCGGTIVESHAQSAVVYRESKEFDAAVEAYKNQQYEAARASWLPLAWQDDLAAMRNIGHLHRNGLGVPQSFDEAFNWYERAAEKGLAGAQANLADMLERGQGREKDLKEALEWFLAAAEQGHVIAQYRLGLMLMRGDGIEKRLDHALQWFTVAAEAGYEPAIRHANRLEAEMKTAKK